MKDSELQSAHSFLYGLVAGLILGVVGTALCIVAHIAMRGKL